MINDGTVQQQQKLEMAEEGAEDVNHCCCSSAQSSTTTAKALEEGDKQNDNNKELDKALELFACSYNLTAQNVKNIIFHIVKNPQTFATLVRKDPDAMAGLRMTRARLRQLERIARRRIPTARLRPIVGPKTFLDINYGDDEDDGHGQGAGTSTANMGQQDEDMDYCPANDPTVTKRRKRRKIAAEEKTDSNGSIPNDDEEEGEDESSMCSSDTDFACSDMDEERQQQKDKSQQHHTSAVGFEAEQIQKQEQLLEVGEAGQSVEFLTKVDNPIYPIFIKSLTNDMEIDPEVRQQLYDDEDNDPEYVFPDFDDLFEEQEDEYEFRRDRATEIPRWEVKALEQDFVEDGEDEPSPLEVPVESICGDGTTTDGRQSANGVGLIGDGSDNESTTVKIFWNSNFSSSEKFFCNISHNQSVQRQDEENKDNDNKNGQPNLSSCSLLSASPIIAQLELDALKIQLEKHVQLLCQAIVGTSQYAELVEPHNKAMMMLRELDALSREHGPQSVFSLPTLEAAIYSAHDIKACREVNLALEIGTTAAEKGDVHHKSPVESGFPSSPAYILHNQLLQHNEELRPSNETMWVLSRSGAVRHPELLCPYRFTSRDGNNRMQSMNKGTALQLPHRFLHSEQVVWLNCRWMGKLLFAIGLYQLNAIPFRNGKMRNRYQLIQQYFLPTKRVDQIRNHIKNVHACPSPTIYHQLIMKAEKGHFPVTYRPDLGEKAQQKAPIEWPENLQPYWLKWLSNLLSKCQTQMVMVDDGGGGSTVSVHRQPQHGVKAQKSVDPILSSPSAAGTTTDAAELLELSVEDQVQQQQNFAEEEGHAVGVETRWQKRIRTASSTTTTTEEGGSHVTAVDGGGRIENERMTTVTVMNNNGNSNNRSCRSSMTNGFGGGGITKCDMATTSTASVMKKSLAENSDDNSGNKCNQNGTPTTASSPQLQQQQKKSRRHERAERGMAALCDAHARGQTERALASAIYEDFGKRMFMHQDKMRTVQRVLATIAPSCHDESSSSQPSSSAMAQCFASLWQLMGLTHPQLFHLFASIAPEALLTHTLRADPHLQACKRALRMLKTIHTYLAASRTPTQMKHMLKFLKEASVDITSEQQFFEALQRQFSVRDEPLWRLLRREWMGSKFVENVEDWEYEFVDMDKQCQQRTNETSTALDNEGHFEHVRLPYRRDPSERSRLRVRHGRVTAEVNGRLCNVVIAYASPTTDSSSASLLSVEPSGSCSTAIVSTGIDVQQQSQKNRNCCWTRKMDMELLLVYKNAGGDAKECVRAFLQRFAQHKFGGSVATVNDVEKRLDQLLNVANTLRKGRKNDIERRDRK